MTTVEPQLTLTFHEGTRMEEVEGFIDDLIEMIESIHLYGGGRCERGRLDWMLDLRESHLSIKEVEKRIKEFLEDYSGLIMDTQFLVPPG